MEKAVGFVVVLVSCLVCQCHCGTQQQVESIPEEIRTPGSEHLGKSLSLDINTPRLRRNYEPELWESGRHNQRGRPLRVYSDRADLLAEGSQVQDHGYQGVNGHSYGDQHKGSDYYEKENSGVSRGEVGFYGRAGKKGATEHVVSDGYQAKERGSHDNRANAGFYDDVSGAKKIHNVGKAYQGAQNHAQNGQEVERQGSKGGHRKGHHKSGFTNSYHKDESGNKSDFYDDVNDEGDHFALNTRDGYFNDQASNKNRGTFQDGAFKNIEQGKKGRFDEGQSYSDQDTQKRNYARDGYVDDKLDYGQRRSGGSYDRTAHGSQEQNDVNRYDKNSKAYGQRRDYLPVPYQPAAAPPAVVPHRNYYPVPVPESVAVDEEYYPDSPTVYIRPPTRPDSSREYYPQSPAYHPAKTAHYDVPVAYGRASTNDPGYAVYSDPKPATHPVQYYLPRSPVYYPPSATY